MQVAAQLAVFGLPVERYLTTSDRDEQLVLSALARAAATFAFELQDRQATAIANAMVKARIGG